MGEIVSMQSRVPMRNRSALDKAFSPVSNDHLLRLIGAANERNIPITHMGHLAQLTEQRILELTDGNQKAVDAARVELERVGLQLGMTAPLDWRPARLRYKYPSGRGNSESWEK